MLVRAATVVPLGLAIGLLSSGSGDRAREAAAGAAAPTAAERGVEMHTRRPVLRGRVLLPDDGSPLGLRVYLDTPTYFDSVDVDAAGGFAFSLPRMDCDSLDIRIDAPADRPHRYHATRLRVPVPARDDSAETIRVLLVPTTFTIAGGSYAGASVPIVVDDAVAGPREHARFWRVSRQSAYGTPIGWPEERFPLPLAVEGRSSALRTADSASIWAIARQLERDFGRTLFRPISLDSAESEGWSVTLSLNPQEDTPGITFITYDGRADVYNATIAIRSSPLLSDPSVVTHELLHVLGFGHAVGWHSVMNNPYQSAAHATASDVAYAQLFYRLRRTHIEQRATHGILESAAEARRRPPIAARPRACPMADPASAPATRRAP